MTTNTLLHRLRTYLGGDLGNEAADEIERLQSCAVSPETIAHWLHDHGLTAVSASDAEKVKRCDCSWRPIDSAPHDDYVLAVNVDEEVFVAVQEHGGWVNVWADEYIESPTHWQPLPEPPKGDSNGR